MVEVQYILRLTMTVSWTIGWSVLDRFEECFQYVENSCFIASTIEAAVEFSRNCWGEASSYDFQEVFGSDLQDDFGCSCRSFAMEKAAFRRFVSFASANSILYESEAWQGNDVLTIVQIKNC